MPLIAGIPTLKFVASHLGGGICEIIGRMDYAYELRDNPLILGPYGPPVTSHRSRANTCA